MFQHSHVCVIYLRGVFHHGGARVALIKPLHCSLYFEVHGRAHMYVISITIFKLIISDHQIIRYNSNKKGRKLLFTLKNFSFLYGFNYILFAAGLINRSWSLRGHHMTFEYVLAYKVSAVHLCMRVCTRFLLLLSNIWFTFVCVYVYLSHLLC